jgi:hypothetical protein
MEAGEAEVLSLAVKKGDESYYIFIPIEQYPTPRTNARQLAWQEAELGIVFHYDLHVFDGEKYRQGNNRITPVENYQIFHPAKLNTDQWIKAAKAAGATFALLTATHETGFALYKSDVNPYCLKAEKMEGREGGHCPGVCEFMPEERHKARYLPWYPLEFLFRCA